MTSILLLYPHSLPPSPQEMENFSWLKINLVECLTSMCSNHILKNWIYFCCLYRNWGHIVEEREDNTFISKYCIFYRMSQTVDNPQGLVSTKSIKMWMNEAVKMELLQVCMRTGGWSKWKDRRLWKIGGCKNCYNIFWRKFCQ